jgi:hypothetical protein
MSHYIFQCSRVLMCFPSIQLVPHPIFSTTDAMSPILSHILTFCSTRIHIILCHSHSQLGSMTYAKITFVLIALTACIQLMMTHVAVTRMGREAERHAHCVGYEWRVGTNYCSIIS